MIPNDPHLIELYWGLRQAGLPLRMEDYQLLCQAWEKGFQPQNLQQLRQLCQRLWVKSLAEKQCFDTYFDQYQKQWLSQIKSAPPDSTVAQAEIEKQSTKQNPAQTPLPPTSLNQPDNLTPQGTEELQVVTAASLNTTSDKSNLPSLFTLSDEYFPLTRRQMKQGWRKLRQPVREGTAVELDIPSTIKRISQQGFLLEPELIPSRVNRTQLLLLIDQSNSMVPFSPISERLIETAMQEGRLGETKIYYFCNVPENFLYTDIDLLEEQALTNIIPHLHKNHTLVLIFSDSGAARGGINSTRVELTKQFINCIKPVVRQVVCLNPLPTNRWRGNTASRVAKLLPMYPFSPVAWKRMINALQGKKAFLGEYDYLTDESSLETNQQLVTKIQSQLEQLKPGADSENYESAINYIVYFAKLGQGYLDFAYHAAFPLALTPDLLYYLRENFLYDQQSQSLNIPWLAVPDLLLSTLCQSAGLPLYEMDSYVRHLLLKLLQQDERFGNKRLEQLSECLLLYLQQRLQNTNLDIQDFGEKPQWIELAYTKPSQLARELALMLQQAFSGDKAEKVRTASLTTTFAEPLAEAGYEPLLTFASGWGRYARGYEQKAKEIFDKLPTNSSELDIAGVKLKIPTRSQLSQFSFDVVTVNSKGKITKRERHQAQYFTENLPNNVTVDMVAIPGGTFMMGAPKTEKESTDDERPQHQVTVPPFLMGKYTVTQAQWRAVATLSQINRELDTDPSHFKGDNLPVENISWYDAVEFCDRLSKYTQKNYRLPSEAEWEYACRGGTTTPFHFGETITPELANYDGNYVYDSGTKGEYREKTTPVGSFQVANSFGLFDMHGNVWEWCYDDWHDNYKGAPVDGSAWLKQNISDNDNQKMLRGGSWSNIPGSCRSAYRNHSNYISYNVGFRVVVGGARTL